MRSTDGVDIAVHDLGGNGQPLLISHATGFHGHCYLPMARSLSDRFHSVAFDYRGHGSTAPAAHAPITWERYGDDAEVVAASIGRPHVAFGHSMGGACLLMAAHRRPELFTRLVLFEPIVFDPQRAPRPDGPNVLVQAARRRRTTFASYEAAIANFAAKPPMNEFTADALDAYVHYGFVEQPDGTVRLSCDPETEAATFEQGPVHHTFELLGEIAVPTLVISGQVEETQPSSGTAAVAERLAAGTYLELDQLNHFGPMTHPDLIAELVADWAGA